MQRLSILLLIALTNFACDNTREIDIQTITPLNYLHSVNARALETDSTMRLYLIETGNGVFRGPVDSNGYLITNGTMGSDNGWSFYYLSKENVNVISKRLSVGQDGRVELSEFDLPILDSALVIRFESDSIFIPANGWIDINDAIAVAMQNGGSQFLQDHPRAQIFPLLSRYYSPERNRLAWSFTFSFSLEYSTTIAVDALTGQLIP